MKRLSTIVFFVCILFGLSISPGNLQSQTYCTATATSTADDDISNVTLDGVGAADINNTTVCSGTYSNFTALPPAAIAIGSSYTLSITLTQCGSFFYNNQCAVWIDWNKDFDFLDAGEKIGGVVAGPGFPSTHTINFTVPGTALLGNTRMRLKQQEGGNWTTMSPCGNITWGEVEDYTVNILPVCAPPNPVTATPNSLTCGGDSVFLNGNTIEAGGTISWFTVPVGGSSIGSSPDSVNFLVNPMGDITYYAEANGPGCGPSTRTPVSVTIADSTAPLITSFPADTSVTNTPNQCNTMVTLVPPTATDGCGIASITNNGPPAGYPIGTTPIIWTVTDSSGNVSTVNQNITVVDGDAPTANCQDVTLTLDAFGQAVLTPSQIDNFSYDNPGQLYNYSYDFSTGPQGFTTGNQPLTSFGYTSIASTWSTTTGFGNPSESYGTMNNGTYGPEHSWIMSPPLTWSNSFDLTFDSYSNNESGSYDQEFVEYSTNGGATWTSAGTHPSFATYGSATWYTITFNVTTSPTTDGRIRFRYNTGDNCCGPGGQQGWYIDNVNLSSSLLCGSPITLTASETNFNCDDIGANPVTLTVTDSYNNSSTCNATVTIVDDMSPIALVQNISVDLNASGTATITPMDIDNGSSDNCGIVLYELSDSVFFCGDSCSSTSALHFDGGDDYVEGTNTSLPQGSSTRTVEAWINPELIAGQIGSICEWGNIATGQRCAIMYNNQRLYYTSQGSTVQGLIFIPQNQWSHVAVTYDGSMIQLYVNGVADVTGYPLVNTNGTTFRIGTSGQLPPISEYFKGGIDDVRIWDYARTQTEIQTSMNKCLNGLEQGLVGYYKLEEGSGTTANDNSSSAASGTLMNATPSAWINATPDLNGSIPVALIVTDGSGNSAAAVAYVDVNDPISPTFTSCPANVDLCEGEKTNTVSYTMPSADDNCSAMTVTQISGLPSGSLFTADTTVNTFVAVDPSGNADTCSFMVVIHPNPVVIFNLANNNVCLTGGTVNMSANPTGGSYSGPGVSGDIFNPMTAGLGNHTVTYTYTDGNGCSSSVSQTFTVISCLGVEGEDDINANIYPNPSNGIFTITLSNLPQGNNSIRLINALGQVMYSAQLTSTHQVIDVSTLAAATYYLQIMTEKGIISRQIVIAQHY